MRLDGRQSSGFELFLHSDAPPGSGLGASSALVVAIVGLLKEFRSLPLTDYEVAHVACRIEREELRIPGGLQDQYAATFGGFNYIEFLGDRVVVNPLRLRDDILNELEHNLLLCYTGSSRVSAGIIDVGGGISLDEAIAEADRLLYQIKADKARDSTGLSVASRENLKG